MVGIVSAASSLKRAGIKLVRFITNKSESKEGVYTSSFGIDATPPKNVQVIHLKTEGNQTLVVSTFDPTNRNDNLKDGESRLYCTDSEGKKVLFDIVLNKDSKCVFNSGEDTSVAFSRLKKEFDELNDKFNDLVSSYNEHSHIYIPPLTSYASSPIPTTGLQTAQPSTASIANAESDTILIP